MGHLKPLITRDPNDPHRAATQLEIFFDLVAVVSIAALTAEFHHTVSQGHGAVKVFDFIGIFVAIWWAWMNHIWSATAFDNDNMAQRALTFASHGTGPGTGTGTEAGPRPISKDME